MEVHLHGVPAEHMRLVEEYVGVGVLAWSDRAVSPVPYRLRRFQAMTHSGLPVPGLHRIEGRLELDAVPDPERLVAHDLMLTLEDGRTVRLSLADADGRVLTEGHGPSRCACC